MKDYYYGIANRFKCIAGDCPNSCCIGWNIVIDKDSVKRYKALPENEISNRIISGIHASDNKFYFKNHDNGRCYMLDADNLCHIQRNYSEDMLCITCRKYPRLIYKANDTRLVSFSASCPVVAHYLINSKSCFYYREKKGSFKTVYPVDLPWCKGIKVKIKKYLLEHEEFFGNIDKTRLSVFYNFCSNYFYYRVTSLAFSVASEGTEEIQVTEDMIRKCETEIDVILYGFIDLCHTDSLTQDAFVKLINDSYRDFAHVTT
ncbi:MAG: flagellin lysine-N-methylase [Lachnospiraceae bacterium]|nr:flagellin lysine-N-methylase [Lachnospiraceae bacterium]